MERLIFYEALLRAIKGTVGHGRLLSDPKSCALMETQRLPPRMSGSCWSWPRRPDTVCYLKLLWRDRDLKLTSVLHVVLVADTEDSHSATNVLKMDDEWMLL